MKKASPQNRLPPGQFETEDLPILDLGRRPYIPFEKWSLSVGGLITRPLVWNWADFKAQPQTELRVDIHCVTTWSSFDNEWSGVSARHRLSVVEPKPEAHFVILHGADGYTTTLPLERFSAGNVLLADTWNGEPLPQDHGGPVRLVVPDLYFWKSAKWLTGITFEETDKPGTWETRGYHNEGDPWKEERFS